MRCEWIMEGHVMNSNKVQLFEGKKVRSTWNKQEEEWYFSVVDICQALSESDSKDPGAYWRKLKQRLKGEGSEVVTKCHELKMISSDGKSYKTDAMKTEDVFRLIQSIPSKKAEPFKVWMAKVANERLEEIADPAKAITRGAEYYRKKGYTEEWIRRRMHGIEIRKQLTDEWTKRGISEGKEFALLTAEMTLAWSGMRTANYKEFKSISPKENLRDNMTDIEIALTDIAEITTTDISRKELPEKLDEHMKVAQRGGGVARATREAYEKELGEKVVSRLNAKDKSALEVKKKRV